MAHELEINEQGQANMFSVHEVPWHGLGVILDKPPTVEEAIKCAGLDWTVRLQPLHMKYDGEDIPVPNGFATVRDTDRKVLGVVGPTYKPLQNKDAFKFFQPFLDANEATIETAGSLRGGTRVWVLARVTQDPIEIVPGDDVLNYILLSNGHDGTLAIRVGLTPTRVCCANTLSAAHAHKASKLLRVRHTKKAAETLDVVRETMDLVRKEFVATAEQYKVLAKKGVRKEDLEAYVRRVFQPKVVMTTPETEAEDDAAHDRLLAPIIRLFEEDPTNNMPGVKGTVWGMYNAVTSYLSHERGRSADNRVNSLWFGDSATVNDRAFDQALQFAVG